MRDRRDNANDAKRSVIFEGDTVFARKGPRSEELDAGRFFPSDDQFLDLVFEPADLGFVEFFLAKHLGFVDADSANAVNCFAAAVQTQGFESALSISGRGSSVINAVKDSPGIARRTLGRRRSSVTFHMEEHFLHDIADQIVGDLQHDVAQLRGLERRFKRAEQFGIGLTLDDRHTGLLLLTAARRGAHRRPRVPIIAGINWYAEWELRIDQTARERFPIGTPRSCLFDALDDTIEEID